MKKIIVFVIFFTLVMLMTSCTTSKEERKSADEILMTRAQEFADLKNYMRAVTNSAEAVRIADSVSYSKSRLYRQKLANYYCAWANHMILFNPEPGIRDYEMAIRLCEKAKEASPKITTRADKMSAEYTKRLEAAQYRKELKETINGATAKERDKKIALALAQGTKYLQTRRYTDARDAFEKVLILDPYNKDAVAGLNRCYRLLFRAGQMRAEVAHVERIAEMEWKNIMPLPPSEDSDMDEGTPYLPELDPLNSIELIIKTLVIEHLKFVNIPLLRVFESLRDETIEDKKPMIEFKFDFNPENYPKVIFESDNITFEDALYSICMAVNLKYEIMNDGRIRIYDPKR